MNGTHVLTRFALTVDCVVFGLEERDLKVMLIQRDLPPFKNQWALPGGFVRTDETTEEAARRELQEETGLIQVFLEQLYTFSEMDRDPRERVVTVAYFALVRLSQHSFKASTDARDAKWFAVDDLPRLAFDHQRILLAAQQRLRAKVRYQPIGFNLLPRKFSLTKLQWMHEVILGHSLDKRNFRKKILSMNILKELDEVETGVAHRAAKLYRFNQKRYRAMVKEGLHFEI